MLQGKTAEMRCAEKPLLDIQMRMPLECGKNIL